MKNAPLETIADLYESDETAWLDAMAHLAGEGGGTDFDFEHLAEFLTDMARRDRREVESRLATLIAHILKWRFQPAMRSRSWRTTVEAQRQELRRLLESRTLWNHAEAKLQDVYADGLRLAAMETGIPEEDFPQACPFDLEHLQSDGLVE